MHRPTRLSWRVEKAALISAVAGSRNQTARQVHPLAGVFFASGTSTTGRRHTRRTTAPRTSRTRPWRGVPPATPVGAVSARCRKGHHLPAFRSRGPRGPACVPTDGPCSAPIAKRRAGTAFSAREPVVSPRQGRVWTNGTTAKAMGEANRRPGRARGHPAADRGRKAPRRSAVHKVDGSSNVNSAQTASSIFTFMRRPDFRQSFCQRVSD